MALIFHEGFDGYPDLSADGGVACRWGVFNDANIALVPGYDGDGQALQITGSTADPRIKYNAGVSEPNYTIGMALKFTTLPNDNVDVFTPYGVAAGSGDNNLISFTVYSDGSCRFFYNGKSGYVSAPGGTITEGTWRYIEIECEISNSPNGAIRLYVDNALVDSVSATDTYNNSFDYFSGFVFSDDVGSSSDGVYAIDNIYVVDVATRLGPQIIEDLRPNADTAKADFTPSSAGDNSADVDEAQHDGDTTYCSGSATDDEDLFDLAAPSGSPVSVTAVIPYTFAKRTDGISRSIKCTVAHNGTQEDGSAINLPETNYGFQSRIVELNPDDASAWEASDLAGLQAGYKAA